MPDRRFLTLPVAITGISVTWNPVIGVAFEGPFNYPPRQKNAWAVSRAGTAPSA
jgi:hypothetical protein